MIRCETCLVALQVADRENNNCPDCKDYKDYEYTTVRNFRESAGVDFSNKATYLTVHRPVKGWSVQQIEFSKEYDSYIPCEFFPNGDILEWSCPSEKDAIQEGIQVATELGLQFNYTTENGEHIWL